MRINLFTEEVFHSWKWCVENRISIDDFPKEIEMGHETFAALLYKHTNLISIFDKVIDSIKLYMGNDYLFLYYQIPIT